VSDEPTTETAAERFKREADEMARNWLAPIRAELAEGKSK
jgi:hypothetical protein